MYEALKVGNFYGGRFVIYGDIRGEEFINETSNMALTSANVVGATDAAKYIAETKVIRALCYYSLLRFYARPYADGNGSKPSVPLRLKGIVGAGESNLARSTVAEVYAQVLKDLNEAETALPLSYTAAGQNTDSDSPQYSPRVYLSMQNYASVITEANKIVSATAPFTSTSGMAHASQSDITNVFTNYTTTESIFSMPMTTTAGDYPGTQNQLAYYYTPGSGTVAGGVGNGEFSLNPNSIIAETSWKSTDKRRAFVKAGTAAGSKSWLFKYKTGSPYTDYVPVMRYSEVLLNLAEAKVQSTNTVDA